MSDRIRDVIFVMFLAIASVGIMAACYYVWERATEMMIYRVVKKECLYVQKQGDGDGAGSGNRPEDKKENRPPEAPKGKGR